MFCCGFNLAFAAYSFAESVSPHSPLPSNAAKRWTRLLQFPSENALRSRARGPQFFFAKDGAQSPEAELEASRKALAEDFHVGNDALHCRFPARARFIRENFPGIGRSFFQEEECRDFLEWRKGLDAQTFVLVFAASYPSNASSLFGHTFLRVRSRNQNPLLDYSINYAAVPDYNDPGIVFGIKGIFGGYPGQYSIQPYYMMTKTYSNLEARDLWEYELRLNEDQMDWILRSLWEQMYQTYYDYFFFDENCAYQILALLEIGLVDYDLRKPFSFFVPPAETLRELARHDELIGSITFRPSILREMERARRSLLGAEQEIFDLLLRGGIPANAAPTSVLDAYLIFLQSKIARSEDPKKRAAATREMLRVALERSKRVEIKKIVSPGHDPLNSPPHLSHKPRSASIFLAQRAQEEEIGATFAMGYHPLLAYPKGFHPALALNYFAGEARWNPTRKLIFLERLLLAEGYSLPLVSPLRSPLSWRFHSSLIRSAATSPSFRFPNRWLNQAGVGYSTGEGPVNISALLAFEGQFVAEPEFALGPELLLRGFWGEKAAIFAQASFQKNLRTVEGAQAKVKVGASYFLSVGNRLELNFLNEPREGQLSFVRQF